MKKTNNDVKGLYYTISVSGQKKTRFHMTDAKTGLWRPWPDSNRRPFA